MKLNVFLKKLNLKNIWGRFDLRKDWFFSKNWRNFRQDAKRVKTIYAPLSNVGFRLKKGFGIERVYTTSCTFYGEHGYATEEIGLRHMLIEAPHGSGFGRKGRTTRILQHPFENGGEEISLQQGARKTLKLIDTFLEKATQLPEGEKEEVIAARRAFLTACWNKGFDIGEEQRQLPAPSRESVLPEPKPQTQSGEGDELAPQPVFKMHRRGTSPS